MPRLWVDGDVEDDQGPHARRDGRQAVGGAHDGPQYFSGGRCFAGQLVVWALVNLSQSDRALSVWM